MALRTPFYHREVLELQDTYVYKVKEYSKIKSKLVSTIDLIGDFRPESYANLRILGHMVNGLKQVRVPIGT